MKNIIMFLFVMCSCLYQSSQAYAVTSFSIGFSAPTIIGTSSVYGPEVGAIVFDQSTSTFYGYNDLGQWVQLGGAAQAVPSGSIQAFGGSSAPSGYLMCDGSAVSRTTYSALFAVLGTTYGAGDGSTTFNLPNLQGVFPRGAGSQTISGINYSATLGATLGDMFQGHIHAIVGNGAVSAGVSATAVADNTSGTPFNRSTSNPNDDGTNGTPRTGSETRPANVGVNYIIKI